MYTWSEPLNTFLIGYDFNQDSSYHTTTPYPYQDSVPALITTSSMITIPSGQIVERQEVSIFGVDGTSSTALYRHIGPDLDLLPPTTDLFFISSVYVSKLRCWEHNGEIYNFSGQPCDTTYTITSTEEIDAGMVRIYPNPTTDIVHIDCKTCSDHISITVSDMSKQTLLTQPYYKRDDSSIMLDLSELSHGAYTVTIHTDSGSHSEVIYKGG